MPFLPITLRRLATDYGRLQAQPAPEHARKGQQKDAETFCSPFHSPNSVWTEPESACGPHSLGGGCSKCTGEISSNQLRSDWQWVSVGSIHRSRLDYRGIGGRAMEHTLYFIVANWKEARYPSVGSNVKSAFAGDFANPSMPRFSDRFNTMGGPR